MPDRLSPLDASFLYMEESSTPMHIGGVALFQVPESGFDADRLMELVDARLAMVPRYRQRVREVPGHLAAPLWIDDEKFDLSYHVRRSALPRPGTTEQLHELVARVLSRPLDRDRPLWEIYLVEGVEAARFAIVTKTHQALVDGISAIEIGEVLFDNAPEDTELRDGAWIPERAPSDLRLVADAVSELMQRPTALVDTARRGVMDIGRSVSRVGSAAAGALKMAQTVTRTAPSSPLNVEIGESRRFATTSADLESFKQVRKVHGGDVNDVVLAVVTGGLRTWLQTRGEPITSRSTVRALVPVSVNDDEGLDQVTSFIVDLPTGEGSPVVRLHQVGYAMRANLETRRAVGAERLAGLAGFAPPTLHALGARVASGLSSRVFNIVITNVPGPQEPRYLAGARLLEAYPVSPLAKGQALSLGVTSYDGTIYFGLYGDRAAMPDLDVLARCLDDALVELVETTT
ncbi:MAG TPA: wax ester/triacylglycerol synthase family O-acyltransferase [Actinomycetes bacterium]|nr:wax ester/triacylglycerol synthase family O-acyltransferase [Actinomycetes bacterium]